MIRSYEDLVVYQKADGLAHAIYDAAQSFPRDELFGLTAQIKRLASLRLEKEQGPEWLFSFQPSPSFAAILTAGP